MSIKAAPKLHLNGWKAALLKGLLRYRARSRAISDSPLPRAIWRRRGNARSAGRACSRTVSISRCSAPTSPKKRSISSTPSIWPCSFRFRTQAEMCALFADLPSALANSVEIAKRCTLTLELGKAKLPLFPTPEALSLDAYLRQLAGQGLEARLEQLFADADERGRQRPVYAQRLAFECDTIIEMGFAGY